MAVPAAVFMVMRVPMMMLMYVVMLMKMMMSFSIAAVYIAAMLFFSADRNLNARSGYAAGFRLSGLNCYAVQSQIIHLLQKLIFIR